MPNKLKVNPVRKQVLLKRWKRAKMPSWPRLGAHRCTSNLQLQERMFKNFVESITACVTKRVDDLVGKVSDLKASLELSQKDIENHKTPINLLDTNLQSTVEEITKHLVRSSSRKQLNSKIKAVEITSV